MTSPSQWFVRFLTFLGALVLGSWVLHRFWPLITLYTGNRFGIAPLSFSMLGARVTLPIAVPLGGLVLALICVVIVIACQKRAPSTAKPKASDAKPQAPNSPEAARAEAERQKSAYSGVTDIIDEALSDVKKGLRPKE